MESCQCPLWHHSILRLSSHCNAWQFIPDKKILSLSGGSVAHSIDAHVPTQLHRRQEAPPSQLQRTATPRAIWSREDGASLPPGPTQGARGCFQTKFNSEKKKREEGEKWEGLEGYETLRLIPLLPCIPRHWSRRSHKSLLTPTVNGYKKAPGFLYVTGPYCWRRRRGVEGGGGRRRRSAETGEH